MSLHLMLTENSLFQFIGKIFHPVFEFFGWILAGLYAIWPNYGFAITGLTILIMLALTPITVKSTKSMIAMQRLQPEMKKLQAKYKGAENRELLNQEMMRLYKENGTSPFGACLPSLLQMPFLIVLYSLIRGLSSTVARGATYVNAAGQTVVCKAQTCGAPKYIPTSSQMHSSLVNSNGQMHWWFGMDLSSYPFSHHTFPGSASQAVLILPYLALIGAAMFLQYYQMKQMNSRNPQAAAANPQMQTMQKFFPIIFGVIYLRVPAGATIYMVVSSAMRIATQEVMFRTGMVTPVAAEREIGASGASGGSGGSKGNGSKDKDNKNVRAAEAAAIAEGSKPKQPTNPPAKQTAKQNKKSSTATDGTSVAKPTVPPRKPASPQAKGSSSNGRTGGRTPGGASANGRGSSSDDAEPEAKPHSRSRSKRTRKAR
jgi:YidC/Oxa1 family membrane protein insertase